MAIGSGISAQFAIGAESTYGTAVTPDHFLEFDDASGLKLTQKFVTSSGLHGGGQMARSSRHVPTTREATGPVKMDFATKKMLLLVRHLIGGATTTPTVISGSAYKTVQQLGSFSGLSLTAQLGIPDVTGTVRPFTYTGTKVSAWDLTCQQGDLLKLTATLDAQDEKVTSPSLAAASYPSLNEAFNFTQCVIKFGGTATTTTGVVSIAGGAVPVSLIRSFSVKGTNPIANARYGTAATKSEPIQDNWTDIRVDFDGEFGTQADIYDVYRAGTVVPIQITFTGSAIVGGGGNNTLDIVLAATKIEDVPENVAGPAMVDQKFTVKVLDDQVNNPCQITIISNDATL